MSDLKIVVIGGVAAGPKAAARAKRCNPQAQVTLIEKGEWISYGGCGLPYFLGATVKDINDLNDYFLGSGTYTRIYESNQRH